MLPGCIEDDSDEIDWSDSFNYTEVEKPFNLLPNGKRKKSVRTKVKNMFRKSYCRRAAYAIDSKSTSLGDGLAVSFGKLMMFMKNSIERLRRSEPSWRRGPWTGDRQLGTSDFGPPQVSHHMAQSVTYHVIHILAILTARQPRTWVGFT